MKPLTKQEAIQEHRKMWNWIADETEKRKRKVYKYEYFEEMNIPVVERPDNDCYCCEYDNQQSNDICTSCPINWDSNVSHNQCVNMNKNGDDEGLYRPWVDANDYAESANLARQIANLPESKDEEDTNNGTIN